jgi:HD-GYP domain-containing protein (c-di-GMP phosphodiesterase class II)
MNLEELLQDPGGISGLPDALRAEIGLAMSSLARGAGASAGGILRIDEQGQAFYYGDLADGCQLTPAFIKRLRREDSQVSLRVKGKRGRDLPCLVIPLSELNAHLRLIFFGLAELPDRQTLEGAVTIARVLIRLARGTRDFVTERGLSSTLSRLLSTVIAPMPVEEILHKLAELISESTNSEAVAIDSYSSDINLIARNLYIDAAWPDSAVLLSRWRALLSLRVEAIKEQNVSYERLKTWRQPLVYEDIQAQSPYAFALALKEEAEFYQDAGVRTVVVQPLWVGKEFVGSLSLANRVVRRYSSAELDAVARIGDVAAVAIKGSQLSREVDESHARERDIYVASIARLAAAAEARDPYTGAHLDHLQHYTRAIVTAMGQPPDFGQAVILASQMHDIGKISLADSILLKPGPLTPEEREVMKKHTVDGEKLLGGRYLEVARKVARWHHERWDGDGYPDGLARDEIPVCARIVSVADVYDALTSERPYKSAWDPERAYEEILRNAGSQFDPEIVDIFGELWRDGALTKDMPVVA